MRPGLPEDVGLEGGVGVDVVVQPPLHRHVPVAHAVADLHAEVCVVAVNVLDGLEVVGHRGVGVGAEADGGPPSGFGHGPLGVAAQSGADAARLRPTPGGVEAHAEHEEHCGHVEQPGDREIINDYPFLNKNNGGCFVF